MSEPPLPSRSDEDARRQRQDALRALAQQQEGVPSTISPTSTAHRNTPWLVVGSLLLVIALVGGAVLYHVATSRSASGGNPTHPAVVVLTPSLHTQACIHDIAWSPSGQQVAVLGYRDQCPSDFPSQYAYHEGALDIYAAATGQLVHTILPDATVLGVPGLPLPPANAQPASAAADTSHPVINYTHVLWSPNGKQLALTFSVDRWSATGSTPLASVRGLVLVNADGTGERAALFTQTSSQYYATIQWNTATMSWNELPPQPTYHDFVSLPPAQSYTWSAADQLVPSSSLTTASSPTSPVGNPDGGSSFTIWQPGTITLSTQGEVNNQTVPVTPGVFSWSTGLLAWSPDGNDIIDTVDLFGLLQPGNEPRPTAAGIQAMGWEGAPTLRVRDAAQQQLLAELSANPSHGDQLSDALAWSPNGRFLAEMPESNAGSSVSGNPTSPPVTFYDSTTGTGLVQRQPQASSHASAGSPAGISWFVPFALLSWSPDGSHFLVFSASLGTVTIWGPTLLPKSSSS